MRSLLLLSLVLISCSNDSGTSPKPGPESKSMQEPAELSSKSLQETLQIKYEQAILSCRLMFNSNLLSESSIDLKSNSNQGQIITLESHSSDFEIRSKLSFNIKKVNKLNHTDLNAGVSYLLKNTPVVMSSGEVRISINNFTERSNFSDVYVVENVKSNISNSQIDNDKIDIECELRTKIHKIYEDQFKIIKKNN